MPTATGNETPSKADEIRAKWGLAVVGIGLLTVLAVVALSVWRFTTAADVTAVVGSVTGVVGTLVGAYFGLQVGSEGKKKADEDKDKAEAKRDVAEKKVEKLAGALPREDAERVFAQFA